VTDIARHGDLALNEAANRVLHKRPAICTPVAEQTMASPDAQAATTARTTTTVPQPRDVERATVERLIASQYSGLRLLIQRRTGNPEVAADILNQAASTAWEKWQAGQVQRPEAIGGYIFQVAMNLLRNRRRSIAERADKHVDSEVLGMLPAETDSADRWVEKKMAVRVKRILQQLGSPRDREILVRFYLQEEDKDTICRDLTLDADQFDKVLHRARGRLKELLESQGLRKTDFFMLCL
jgi:RNA polymerase sigma-70 factor, ECF subfamily